MKRWNLYLALTFTLIIGAWGCSRSTTASVAMTERLQSLEAKTIRLEEDFKTSSAQRDQFRKKLMMEEESRAQLQAEVDRLQATVKELNLVKTELAVRTAERNDLQNQYDSFRKSLRDILSQADASANAGKKQNVPAIPTSGLKEDAKIQTIPAAILEAKKKSGL
ncbi:hypothetical protein KIH39_17780 [Telmatocola sphagniphila]|jgi:septal ring factor EnvC (AmiA/AmiB activator)|uniref:Uncharacterized protein n=1 Tax=Telmatocola sphagniphila TaxID=1123043 RepID=A0A8E6B5D4_9BACT|nr:hypothetical protein [Telmatocola sphagniphila]QVL30695.1 hypothetical protein KIH39_17780 [Telmatocola sphagniphila]